MDKNRILEPDLTLAPNISESSEKAIQNILEESVDKSLPTLVKSNAEFTEEESKKIEEFASQIELENANMILLYGVGAQKKIADFSASVLNNLRTKDMGEAGDALSDLVIELQGFDPEGSNDKKGIFGFFKRKISKLAALKARYEKCETNVEKICESLEKHQIRLLKDVAFLDNMYELNSVYFKELSMYIAAGKKKLAQIRDVELPKLVEKGKTSGLPEDAQEANDLANLCDRFDKKLHDLELTKIVSLQMAPQIRLVQSNNILMSEKIQSTLVNSIPLWKSQMVLAIGIVHSAEAVKAQRKVTDMTNELLKKNAETLKTGTLQTYKESERGIIDVETLKETNEKLISTIDEVLKIRDEGRAKRRQAEAELAKIESDLKAKLLSVK